MQEITPKDAERQAKSAVEYTLDELINPSDAMDGATEWSDIPDERIERECYDSANIMLGEQQQPFYGLVYDLAIQEWYRDMPRINMDHLNIDDKRKAVVSYDYWPMSMSKHEVHEILQEYTDGRHDLIPTDVWAYAWERVENGMVEGMKP